MADNRKVNHGVRMDDGRVITDVDELAEVMTPAMQKRFEASGAIEGDWKAKGKAKAKAEGDLEGLTVAELKDKARDAEVEGFSTMNKAELVAALGG